MVPLNFDDPVLGRTACAAAFFQLSGQRPDPGIVKWDSQNNGNGLPSAPFRFTPDTDDAVAAWRYALFPADAAVDRPGTLRADPA